MKLKAYQMGDRTIRCWAYAENSSHKFGASVKGIGSKDPALA